MAEKAADASLRTAGSFKDPLKAIAAASGEGAPVLCCGSLFLVGYIKERRDGI